MQLDTKRLIEYVGVLTVVASLLFVGMQLYLDRQIASAEQYQNRAESRKSDLRTLLESDAYLTLSAERWDAGNRPRWWNEEIEAFIEKESLSNTSIRAVV